MGIKGAYEAIEEKYYGLMDWLQDRKIPVYSVIDAFEKRGVPTFPLFIIILIVLAFLAYSLISGGGIFLPINSAVEISVQDSDEVLLKGAEVTLEYKDASKVLTTAKDGKASWSVPYGSEVKISVSLPGYQDKSGSFKADQLSYKYSITLEALKKTIRKTVQFVDNVSGALITKELQLSFSCTGNASFSETKTTSTGSSEIEVPEDCGSLQVSAQNGFEVQGNGSIDLSDEVPKILLSEPENETGSAFVTVQDQDNNPLSGIQVNLVSEIGERIGPNATGEAGTALFEGIAVGSYYVIAYDAIYGTVETVNMPDGTKQVQKGQRTEFNIAMQKQGAGKIKILVKDKVSGVGVQNATVALLKDKDKQITSLKTDATGRVEFTVSENVNTYSVQVDALQYLKATLAGISPSATEHSLELTQATSSNSSTLAVSLSDEAGFPVEDARLRLTKVSDGSVVAETITGMDGKASFERLDEASYLVRAFKPGYGENTSGAVAVSTRQPNSLEMQIVIGSGTAVLEVFDQDGNPLNGATIKAFSQFSGQQAGAEKITSADGKAEMNVRADKTVYLQVQASGLADYYTLPMQIPKGATKNVSAKMEQEPGSLGLELLGYYFGAEEASNSLAEGQKYTARLALRVPAGESLKEAGVHFRTGSDDSDSVEKDALFVKSGSAAGAVQRKGSSYTRPSGSGADLSHLTNGNAKWAELAIKNPKPGVYEVAFDVQVRSGTALGTVLESHYRAWAKSGSSYIRFPLDSMLGESESITGKQALYAYTKTDILSVGPSALCNDAFCYTFTIEDLGSSVQTSVIDEYSATISSKYRLYFSLTSRSSQLYGNAKLKVASQGGGAQLGDYSVTIVGGAKRTGKAQANSLEVEAGSISGRDNVSGSIDFATAKEGGTSIGFSILSGSAVFQKSILVNVEGANQMAVSVIPKTIIPFVQNDILITAFDNAENAISEASVTIRKNDSIIATGTTDSAGTFAYSLAAVNAGTVITISIEKTGFSQFERKMTVSQNIITFAPEKASILLIANGKNTLEKAVMVQNNTAIPLSVSEVKASSDFSGMVKFNFAEEYAGKALENGTDFNIGFTVSLTDAGKQITAPKTIKGSILLRVQSSSMGKEWIAALPVEVRIGFGGEVDDSTCLVLSQKKWSISAAKSAQTITLDLKNTCTVDSKPIALQALQAKATRANTNALGSYSITSNIENGSNIVLTSSYSDIAPTLASSGEYTVSITFTPADIVSGKADEKIILKAKNPTNASVEEITVQLDVSIVVSDLSQCIVVSQQKQIFINTCPFNTGYGNYGNYFPQNPMSPIPISPFQNYGYAPGGLQQQYYSNFPNSQFRSPNYDGFFYNQGMSPAFASQYFCGKGEFRVANNCTTDVHLDLDAHPAIQASQTSFDLKPSEDKKITIEAGYQMGRYPIEVRAKVKGSADAPILIQTIQAIIQSSSEVNYDCIVLDPAEKISITEFIGKPVPAKVYNNCYDQGIRLHDSSQNPISICEYVPYSTSGEYSSPNAQRPATGRPYASSTGACNGAPSQMVLNIRAMPKVVKPGADNKLIEEMNFIIIPNISWREQAPLKLQGSTFRQVGALRMFLTQGYYRVEEMADVIVRYSNSTGQVLAKQFPITLEDMFAAGEFLDALSKGNKEITDHFEQCIGGEGISAKTGTTEFNIKVDASKLKYENGAWKFTISPLLISDKHCGGIDALVIDKVTTSKSKNYNVEAKITSDHHKIEITITLKPGAQPAKEDIEINISLKIIRPSTKDGAKQGPAGELKIKVSIDPNATPGGEVCEETDGKPCIIETPDGGTIQAPVKYCNPEKGEYTGTAAAFQKYGFDKLLWTWDFDQVGWNNKGWSCDTKGQGYYCDATQFQIELNKKAALIYSYAKKYDVLSLAGNSLELAGLSKKKAVVNDHATPDGKAEALEFFMTSDTVFLEDAKIDASTQADLKNFVNLIKGITSVSSGNAKGITDSAGIALKNLVKGPYKDKIIIVLSGMDADSNTLYELGAEKPVLKGGAAMADYVMTIREYERMHRLINENTNTDCATSACKIDALMPDNKDAADKQTEITAKFLGGFYKNSKFIVGINSKSLDRETLRKIVEGAQDKADVKAALPTGYGYDSFKDFYFDLVDFEANLKKDKINEAFIADFEKVYKDSFDAYFQKTTNVKPQGAKLLVNGRAEMATTATYSALFKFGMEKGPDELALTGLIGGEGALPLEYRQNPLFFIPFDGEVGLLPDGTLDRKDYGAGYGVKTQNINRALPLAKKTVGTGLTSEKTIELPTDTSGSNALVKLDAQYLTSESSQSELVRVNEEMRNGLILSVSNSSLKFGQSKAVPLALKITAGAKGAEVAYNIAKNEGILTGMFAGYENGFNVNYPWLSWDFVCSTTKPDFGSTKSKYFQLANTQDDKKISRSFRRDYRGFEWEAPTTSGTMVIKSLAIKPYQYSLVLGSLEATDKATLACPSCSTPSKQSLKSIDSGSGNYIDLGSINDPEVEAVSISKSFDLLKGEGAGKACLSFAKDGAMSLKWNKDYYYAQLKAGAPSALDCKLP